KEIKEKSVGSRNAKEEKMGKVEKINFKSIVKNKEINMLIDEGNNVLKAMGYTEHSKTHAVMVAQRAGWILKNL
ncbi:hypothetical protein RFY12_09540, partial [Acinetobacter baumannii]|nr:hypothetical protein [Acinetobacter baumannii]